MHSPLAIGQKRSGADAGALAAAAAASDAKTAAVIVLTSRAGVYGRDAPPRAARPPGRAREGPPGRGALSAATTPIARSGFAGSEKRPSAQSGNESAHTKRTSARGTSARRSPRRASRTEPTRRTPRNERTTASQ